jgi:hypothetical protein
MEHYIVTDSDRHTAKIEQHLRKFINPCSPVWSMSSDGMR